MKQPSQNKGRIPVFRERLRELMRDMSNTEFAKTVGLSRQTIGFYLNGDRIPDAQGLVQIAEKCKVSTDWLLGISDVAELEGDERQVCNYTGLSEKAVNNLHWLHSNRTLWDMAVLDFIQSFLCADFLRFRSCAWKYAFASVQAEKSRDPGPPLSIKQLLENHEEYVKTPEYLEWKADNKEKRNQFNKSLFEEAIKPKGTAKRNIEISAYTYARFEEEEAIKIITNSAESVLRNYLKNVRAFVEQYTTGNDDEADGGYDYVTAKE